VKLPFTLALVLPPLDLNRTAIRAAEAGRSEAGAHLEASVVQALSAVDAAMAEQGAAQAALAKVREVELPAAQKQGRQADDAFAAGEIDRAEWGASKALALQGELAALDTLRRAQEAQAALEDALRRPLDGPELAIDGAALAGANP
jgi:CRISPR system Cascade subunit CasA